MENIVLSFNSLLKQYDFSIPYLRTCNLQGGVSVRQYVYLEKHFWPKSLLTACTTSCTKQPPSLSVLLLLLLLLFLLLLPYTRTLQIWLGESGSIGCANKRRFSRGSHVAVDWRCGRENDSPAKGTLCPVYSGPND